MAFYEQDPTVNRVAPFRGSDSVRPAAARARPRGLWIGPGVGDR
jgi:hypothetical protein